MKLFVWEYLSSGACPETERFPSLATEGWAMWSSLADDCVRIPGLEVFSILSSSRKNLHGNPAVHVRFVEDVAEEHRLFYEFIQLADAVCLIAPETDGLLQQRVAIVEQIRQERGGLPDLWNATSAAIAQCTDKFLLAGLWQNAGIPTPATNLWNGSQMGGYPCVIKPRDGAGSQATFLLRNSEEEKAVEQIIAEERGATFDRNAFIRQPYFSGRALSVAVMVDSQANRYLPLPLAEQRMSDDGRFRYQGGMIPADDVSAVQLQELAIAACRVVPGLRGYVGVDLVLPDDPKVVPLFTSLGDTKGFNQRGNSPPLQLSPKLEVNRDEEFAPTASVFPATAIIIEINPRLTTSYLGYRALCHENLALSIQNPSPSNTLTWKSGPIQFDSSGGIR